MHFCKDSFIHVSAVMSQKTSLAPVTFVVVWLVADATDTLVARSHFSNAQGRVIVDEP